MTRRLPLATLLASLAALLPPAVRAQTPTLIFGASASEDSLVQLDLVASFTLDHFDSLPRGEEDDPRAAALRNRTYSSGRRYWLYDGGAVPTALTASGALPPACVGLAGVARPARPLPAGWTGLAASDSSLRHAATRRSPTPGELARLRAGASSLFNELGAAALSADTALVITAWVLEQAGSPRWLLATFRTRELDAAGEATIRAVFVVLDAAPGAARPALSWSYRALEDDAQVRVPVDVLDLDHDGWPELFTRTTYSESSDYQVWRWQNGRWQLWLEAGGSGC